MNLEKLFEAQRELSQKIVETKGLQGKGLLDEKILALQVELGELANEWRGFKFWSEDREPRTSIHVLKKEYRHLHITRTGMWDYQLRDEFGKVIFDDVTDYHHDHKNPLLEEYVDCLHFILDIGIELEVEGEPPSNIGVFETCVETFNQLFREVSMLMTDIMHDEIKEEITRTYTDLFGLFIGLGSQLGFTTEQIEEEYYRKNKINHARQENGY